jgi:cytochrome c oxidase assembly protein subunit 15
VVALAAVEALQAAVGFIQYFAGLPVGVVMLHMLGAGLVVAAATWLLVAVVQGDRSTSEVEWAPRAGRRP